MCLELQAQARQAVLTQEAASWRARFEARPQREEDAAAIAALAAALEDRDAALQGAEARMAALRGELLLRWAWPAACMCG
jgi:ferric-dicitrate binding protein FerR (iron transport regulator)